MLIKGDQQNDLRTYRFSNGFTMQETMLLMALKTQAKYNLLMTNPRVTGYSSFAKAVIGVFNLENDTPKTCKTLYKYLISTYAICSMIIWFQTEHSIKMTKTRPAKAEPESAKNRKSSNKQNLDVFLLLLEQC